MMLYVNWRAFGDKPNINDMPCDVAQEFLSICNIAEGLEDSE
jgi:hypothetical protein